MITGVNRNPTGDDLRRFAYAMLFGFAVLGVAAWAISTWRGGTSLLTWTGSGGHWAAVCLWMLGIVLAASTRLPYPAARAVYVVWMTGSSAVGFVVSNVVLTLLFLFVLPVFSLIVRRKDPLRKRLTPGKSYWEPCPPYEPTMERMRRMF